MFPFFANISKTTPLVINMVKSLLAIIATAKIPPNIVPTFFAPIGYAEAVKQITAKTAKNTKAATF